MLPVFTAINSSEQDRSASNDMLWPVQDVYNVRGSVRGRAVIISVEHFTDISLPTRSGNEADVDNLKKLMESLHFTVKTVDNRTDEVINSNMLVSVCD